MIKFMSLFLSMMTSLSFMMRFNDRNCIDSVSGSNQMTPIGDATLPSTNMSRPSGVTSADNDLNNVNFVHYDISRKVINYEGFDSDEYYRKTTRGANRSRSFGEDKSADDIFDGNPNVVVKKSSCGPNRSIVYSDDRIEVSNPKSGDYLKTAFIRTGYRVYNPVTCQDDSKFFRGTGFLIGRNLMMTAAHCVYSDVSIEDYGYEDNRYNPKFAQQIDCFFGINGSSDLSQGENYQYYARGKVISIEYSYYLDEATNQDWAIIELDRNIGDTIGWFDVVPNWYNTTSEVVSFGYPADDNSYYYMKETRGHMFDKNKFKYFNDLDTLGGHSGSPHLVSINDQLKVIGVHTTGHGTYNGGTIINSHIYAFLDSFYNTYEGNRTYDYLDFKLVSKSSNVWTVRIINPIGTYIDIEYNKKMCFETDGRNWTHLSDLQQLRMKPYEEVDVTISENFFATTITASYENYYDDRLITYAKNLSVNLTLNVYNNLI